MSIEKNHLGVYDHVKKRRHYTNSRVIFPQKFPIFFSELCYEVALGDFDMGQEELEKLAKNITNAVTMRWGKTDPSFEDSWRSVLRDAAETIGLDVNISEPEVENLEKKKEMDKLVAKLDEVSRREQIKDMELAQLRAKVENWKIIFFTYLI